MKEKVTKTAALFLAIVFVLVSVILPVMLRSAPAHAASAKVDFTAKSQNVKAGDVFHVVCTVSSTKEFNDVEMNLLYDAALFQFVQGGSKAGGDGGVVRISSVGNEDAVKKKTFSLQFKALRKGRGSFIDENVKIRDASGENFSVSANLLTVNVSDGGAAAPLPSDALEPEATPEPTPEVVLSTNNKLKALSFNGLSMTPDFNPEVLEYKVNVDYKTEVLYFSYVPGHGKQKVRLKDNSGLVPGENTVKVVVSSESGDKRVYKIQVVKETEEQTKVREKSENGSSDFAFSVFQKKNSIFIQNQYQFEVVNVDDKDVLPSGYVKTSVELDGKSVPAYTMENDLENNYLLMYLKGVGGEPTLYQYDREEKTIQRYTGTMVQKVNEGGHVADEVEIVPNAWLYAAIVFLMVLVLALLIVILNMVLRRKISKGRRELDDLDF